MKHVYSFIAEFKGGIYISQVAATDLRDACFSWAKNTVRSGEVENLNSELFQKNFLERIDELPPSAIEGCSNVWLFSLMPGRSILDVHIIKTSNVAEPEKQKVQTFQIREDFKLPELAAA